MLTEVHETVLDVPYSDTEYPRELMERWDRETEIAELKISTGEIKVKSVREQLLARGIELD